MSRAEATRCTPVDVQFSLLGPVRAWRGPAELDLGPKQQRAILALLLVRADQLVTIDDLIELLWEQNPPGSAVNVSTSTLAPSGACSNRISRRGQAGAG